MSSDFPKLLKKLWIFGIRNNTVMSLQPPYSPNLVFCAVSLFAYWRRPWKNNATPQLKRYRRYRLACLFLIKRNPNYYYCTIRTTRLVTHLIFPRNLPKTVLVKFVTGHSWQEPINGINFIQNTDNLLQLTVFKRQTYIALSGGSVAWINFSV